MRVTVVSNEKLRRVDIKVDDGQNLSGNFGGNVYPQEVMIDQAIAFAFRNAIRQGLLPGIELDIKEV